MQKGPADPITLPHEPPSLHSETALGVCSYRYFDGSDYGRRRLDLKTPGHIPRSLRAIAAVRRLVMSSPRFYVVTTTPA